MSERSKSQNRCRSLPGALALALCFGVAGPVNAAELYGLTVGISLAPIHEEFKVDKPPYGAEHAVAMFSKDDLPELHAALASMTTPD